MKCTSVPHKSEVVTTTNTIELTLAEYNSLLSALKQATAANAKKLTTVSLSGDNCYANFIVKVEGDSRYVYERSD